MADNAAPSAWMCSACGTTFDRNFDACTECGTWNAAIPAIGLAAGAPGPRGRSRWVLLADAKPRHVERIKVAEPWQTALGGGLAARTCVLVWGSPKSGKTTEALRLATSVPGARYVPCEPGQDVDFLRMVCDRERWDMSGLRVADLERPVTMASVCAALLEAPHDGGTAPIVVVDSLSKLGGPAELAQLRRACAASALVCILHATKDRRMSGKNELAHDVDTVVRVTKKHLVVAENRYAAGPGVVRAAR